MVYARFRVQGEQGVCHADACAHDGHEADTRRDGHAVERGDWRLLRGWSLEGSWRVFGGTYGWVSVHLERARGLITEQDTDIMNFLLQA